MQTGIVSIRIRRGDKVFHVHGEKAGAEGVWLAQGQVQGIYDAPVKTTYKSGAFQVGSKYKGKKRLHRDMVLGFHIADTANSYEFNESAFRQIFQYELDPWDVNRTPTTIEVETAISGTRCLDVLMYEQPDFAAAIDPLKQQYGNLIMKLRAAQPDWYEADYTDTFSSTATSATGTITVSNPTDQVAYQRYILTNAVWSVPDVQWQGGPAARTPGGTHVTRHLTGVDVPAATSGDGAIVEWDRSQLAFRDANNTNLVGQIGQQYPVYPIPPQTPPTPLTISYVGAPAGGAMARVEVPRRWSRPWGMELQDEVAYLPPLGSVTFSMVGTWSYEIPPDSTHIDVVMLGGGGGGGASAMFPGNGTAVGGSAAPWTAVTLVRGDNLPFETSVLYGEVGAGGKGGVKETWAALSGSNGGNSTCQADGLKNTIIGYGGVGSGHAGHTSGDDVFGPTVNYNGVLYTGGSTQSKLGQPGLIPGGGGAAGKAWSSGADGARGQVWIKAYRVE